MGGLFVVFLGGDLVCVFLVLCLFVFVFKKRKMGIKLGRWEGNKGGSRSSLG